MPSAPCRHVGQQISRETHRGLGGDALAILIDVRVEGEDLLVGQQLSARIGAVAAVEASHVAEGKVLGLFHRHSARTTRDTFFRHIVFSFHALSRVIKCWTRISPCSAITEPPFANMSRLTR